MKKTNTNNRRKQAKVWIIRIFAIFLSLLMIGGTVYYSLLFLFQ